MSGRRKDWKSGEEDEKVQRSQEREEWMRLISGEIWRHPIAVVPGLVKKERLDRGGLRMKIRGRYQIRHEAGI